MLHTRLSESPCTMVVYTTTTMVHAASRCSNKDCGYDKYLVREKIAIYLSDLRLQNGTNANHVRFAVEVE